ncbi:transcription elongation factor GreA [Hyunsoonleella jejuensis]|uniref:Transcription elongation factor GreA n=2 Tax=Hyunsoonleella jejuensis TaxID=419940 RepID=A0A1H9BVT8_9FLAO|nr:transcription elongation factor GreA [Hyunsoonleella jejuensis]
MAIYDKIQWTFKYFVYLPYYLVKAGFFYFIPVSYRGFVNLNDEVMSKVSYYTPEGLKKLRDELQQLKDVERVKASKAIAEARDKGDLSENAEYDAAKEAQGMLEMRIAKLEEALAGARIIDESQLDMSKALVLSKVKIKNQTNGMEMTYTLVADGEADLASGKISVNSPIGKGLLGKSVGEVAEIQVPNGVMKFDIIEISR